jgi:hypothetical protein
MPIKKDKILNPKTGRMVLKTSALGKKILKEMNDLRKDLKELKTKTKKKEIKIKEGYEIINEKLYKICKDGQIRNPKTNKCIKEKKEPKKEIKELKEELKEEIKEVKEEVREEPKEEIKEEEYEDANEEFEEEEVKINLNNFNTYINNPLNYKFNKLNVKKFLDACDNETRQLSKKIIENTKHVSFKEMIKYLNMNLNELKELKELSNKERPLFIYINKSSGIEKSNYWIYLYLKDYLKFYNPKLELIVLTNKIIDNKKLKNDDIIIMIDDSFYNWCQISRDIEKLINKNNLKLNIFILASFISKDTNIYINNLNKNNKNNFKIILNSHFSYIPNINDYLNDIEIDLLTTYYAFYDKSNSDYNITFEFFKSKNLIYFDHKLNDTISSIPLFYSGVVPNSHNKKLFNEDGDIPQNLEIIPLLTNCENVRNIRMYDPECPVSPYKDNINDIFIEKEVNKSNVLLELWKKIKF